MSAQRTPLSRGLLYFTFGLFGLLAGAAGMYWYMERQPAHEAATHPLHNGHGAGAEPSSVAGYAIVRVDPYRQQLIGIRTGKVVRDKLVMSIRTVGIIEPDQTRQAHIHTRITGWASKVHVNFVGREVRKGDPLIEIYSPELLTTQQEYLVALRGVEARPDSETQRQLAAAGRRRLELWGVSSEEIKKLEESRQAQEHLILRAPIAGTVLERQVLEGSFVEPAMELYRIADLSVVWLQAKIYEHELPHIVVDQLAQVTLPSQPGEVFEGRVAFIEPVLAEMTRTVNVRVEIPNESGAFRPGMYADLHIIHPMGEGLLVAESAVLRTGERAIAFRSLPAGKFEPVEVKLGSRFGEQFEVLSGLAEGDEVVVSGNFLLDADSRLKAVIGAAGHGH